MADFVGGENHPPANSTLYERSTAPVKLYVPLCTPTQHPATARVIPETDIHANHAEAFFSSLRRKCATFRRKTNMYAKSTEGLQRLLRVYWVVHNFLRVHFTPTVSLALIYLVASSCGYYRGQIEQRAVQ
jgi:hypothetical protein